MQKTRERETYRLFLENILNEIEVANDKAGGKHRFELQFEILASAAIPGDEDRIGCGACIPLSAMLECKRHQIGSHLQYTLKNIIEGMRMPLAQRWAENSGKIINDMSNTLNEEKKVPSGLKALIEIAHSLRVRWQREHDQSFILLVETRSFVDLWGFNDPDFSRIGNKAIIYRGSEIQSCLGMAHWGLRVAVIPSHLLIDTREISDSAGA